MIRGERKLAAVVGALAAVAALGAWAPASGQESGAQVWSRTCGRCHRAQPPNKYDADSWKAIVGHMALYARLTAAEEDAVREFLMGAARRLTLESSPEPSEGPRVALDGALASVLDTIALDTAIGSKLFQRQCVACHGAKGRGDGPAAAALTPRPSDLTDRERLGQLSDEELGRIIAEGKGAMPGFGRLLKPEQLEAVVRYVRRLSAAKDTGGGKVAAPRR